MAELALGFDAAAMELRDMFHNREAETGAASTIVAARFVGAVEALENARQIFFADADSVVAHIQDDFIFALPSDQPNLAVLT